ncbi:unnamed protein product [Amoebophrya sp. A25]|nr:unnamed protein product [Amoebophrya sp. A25]|eukprot:GSA25T00026853001.1
MMEIMWRKLLLFSVETLWAAAFVVPNDESLCATQCSPFHSRTTDSFLVCREKLEYQTQEVKTTSTTSTGVTSRTTQHREDATTRKGDQNVNEDLCEKNCKARVDHDDSGKASGASCVGKNKPASLMQLWARAQLRKSCPKPQPCNCKCVCPETVYQTPAPPALIQAEDIALIQEEDPIPLPPNFEPPPPPDWRTAPCPEAEPCNCYCHCRRPPADQE